MKKKKTQKNLYDKSLILTFVIFPFFFALIIILLNLGRVGNITEASDTQPMYAPENTR